MAPDYAGGERCDVYADRAVITNVMGYSGATALTVSETRKINLKGNLPAIIELAKAEKVSEKPNGLCDGPSTTISANSMADESLLLFSTGGCGNPSKQRNGVATYKLTSLVDLYCPKTFNNDME